MNTIEIARKIKEIAKFYGRENDVTILTYYNIFKEAVWMEDGTPNEKIRNVCTEILKDTLENPNFDRYKKIPEGDTFIYVCSIGWTEGFVVLAGYNFDTCAKTLEQAVKELRINVWKIVLIWKKALGNLPGAFSFSEILKLIYYIYLS